jgi:dihydroflavonol-4-reductase
MLNELPLVPQLHMPFCDVRNAAHAHICAMTNDRANGQRFIVSAQPSLWFTEMAQILQDHFGQFGIAVLSLIIK